MIKGIKYLLCVCSLVFFLQPVLGDDTILLPSKEVKSIADQVLSALVETPSEDEDEEALLYEILILINGPYVKERVKEYAAELPSDSRRRFILESFILPKLNKPKVTSLKEILRTPYYDTLIMERYIATIKIRPLPFKKDGVDPAERQRGQEWPPVSVPPSKASQPADDTYQLGTLVITFRYSFECNEDDIEAYRDLVEDRKLPGDRGNALTGFFRDSYQKVFDREVIKKTVVPLLRAEKKEDYRSYYSSKVGKNRETFKVRVNIYMDLVHDRSKNVLKRRSGIEERFDNNNWIKISAKFIKNARDKSQSSEVEAERLLQYPHEAEALGRLKAADNWTAQWMVLDSIGQQGRIRLPKLRSALLDLLSETPKKQLKLKILTILMSGNSEMSQDVLQDVVGPMVMSLNREEIRGLIFAGIKTLFPEMALLILNHTSWYVRQDCVELFIEQHDKMSDKELKVIVKALSDSDVDVRKSALEAMDQFRYRKHLPFLIELLDDSHPAHIQTAAREAIERIRSQ